MLEHQQFMSAAIITLYCCRQPKPLFLDQIIRKLESTRKTREQLNLPTVGKETLLIKTFVDNSASVKECDIVKLCIRTIDAMIVYVTAYVVPVICSPVSNQVIQ